MPITAILPIVALAIEQGPAVYNLIMKIINGIQREFTSSDEQIKALNDLLLLMSPMEKEV
jgi:hypothetical protein